MKLTINGKAQERPNAMSVAELLAAMALSPQRVAVELNKRLVPRAQHAQTPLAEGDVMEIVTLVGGG